MQQDTREMSSPKRYKVSGTRLYYTAAVCLIIVVSALRFYDLPSDGLGGDEAAAALNSRGTPERVLWWTRYTNSSPILYPLALWAVQKVESSSFSIRIIPAIASVLTVAFLLFLLPRVGVSREAAFVAALLATVSTELIYHAQDGREYSVDTLVAVLMIAGLLSYLKNGNGWRKNLLLCASLFIAPLVQYGLVLFGAAVLGTIATVEGKTLWVHRNSLRDGLQSRAGWVWIKFKHLIYPVVSFSIGCAISYETTLRHQRGTGSFGESSYLSSLYYLGEYSDVRSVVEFASNHTWEMLNYLISEPAAVLGVVAFGIYMIISLRKARLDTVTVLFIISIAIAVFAALMRAYPYGYARQTIYLAPIVFLMFGHSLYSIADSVHLPSIRLWMARTGVLLGSGFIVFSGVSAIRDDNPYQDHQNMERILDALKEQTQQGDAVFAIGVPSLIMRFNNSQKPSNYYYTWGACFGHMDLQGCVNEILDVVDSHPDRLWITGIAYKTPKFEMLEEVHREFHNVDAVHLVVDGFRSDARLYLIELPDLFDSLRKPLGDIKREGKLIISSNFDVYLRDDALAYVKEPCSLSDVERRLFLHITPTNTHELPDDRKQYGFDNLNFDFFTYGIIIDEKCVAVRDLPQYEIKRISTGQFGEEGKIWEAEFRVGFLEAMTEAYQYAANHAPTAQSVFDVYRREGTIIYVKEPCIDSDAADPFFLHVTPRDNDDLPDDRKQHGFDNLDFDFFTYGTIIDEKCVAVHDLPQYEIRHISTGQFGEEGRIWEAEFGVGFLEAMMTEAYQYAANHAPTVQSVFDVYRREGTIIYVKEPCVDSDTADRFFLHVTPRDNDDLPDDRKQHAFDNLDFDFSAFGIVTDGRCIAVRDIPQYDIQHITTGQFTEQAFQLGEGGPTWNAEFSPNEQERGQTDH